MPPTGSRSIERDARIPSRCCRQSAKVPTCSRGYRPIAAVVAGKQSKQGRILGHAGAFAGLGEASAEFKAQALSAAGVEVVKHPSQFPGIMSGLLRNNGRSVERSVGLPLGMKPGQQLADPHRRAPAQLYRLQSKSVDTIRPQGRRGE